MTTAHHLRLIDGMRTKDFPPERVSSGSGVSGPGYHTELLIGEDGHEEGDGADSTEHRVQCLAEHDALLTLLTLRWGEPDVISLWSAQERMAAGEVIAEPWAEPVASCEYLQLWRTQGRWVAVVLYQEDDGPGCELGVLVTAIDPP
ncbi:MULTISPECIES: hypothetical protein [Streptomyces]|uniref:Uncharacterized protein n=1 Tax=Streptomyces mutomycini TaxID=284036 RepID=A0ABW0B9Z1_9ACTN|nr:MULTISPECIES: hypothetical protein [Streptomyces]KPC78191.1 hypothetical protein ADK82_31800 [Streptomyces sp. NRRL S-4]